MSSSLLKGYSMSFRIVTILVLIFSSRFVFAAEGLVLHISTEINKLNFFDYSISTSMNRTYIPLIYDKENNIFLDEDIIVTNSSNIPNDENGFYYEYDVQSLTSQCEKRGNVIFENFIDLRINDVPLEDYLAGDKKIALNPNDSQGFLQTLDKFTLYTKDIIPDDDIYYCSGQLDYMVSLSL